MPQKKKPTKPLDAASQRLVLDNQALVGKVINQLANHPFLGRLGIPDANAAGYLGLCRAAAHFDPLAGNCFSTYAVLVIRRTILEAARSAGTVTLPSPASSTLGKESYQKARKAWNTQPLSPYRATLLAPPPQLHQTELSDELKHALLMLPIRQRIIISMTVLDGHSIRDIAKEVGRNRTTLQKRRSDGLARLKQILLGRAAQ